MIHPSQRRCVVKPCDSSLLIAGRGSRCQVKGIAEGLSIKLGEMMDQPRHQRIARIAKEEEEKRKGMEQQQISRKEIEARRQKQEQQRELNRQAFEGLLPCTAALEQRGMQSNRFPLAITALQNVWFEKFTLAASFGASPVCDRSLCWESSGALPSAFKTGLSCG